MLAGVAQRQPTFFASPKKVGKERRPQGRRPLRGCSALLARTGRLRNSWLVGRSAQMVEFVLATQTSSPTAPALAALLDDSHGDPNIIGGSRFARAGWLKARGFAVSNSAQARKRSVLDLRPHESCRVTQERREKSARTVRSGKHRPQPFAPPPRSRKFRSGPTFRVTQGTPKGRRTWVAFSLGTFFWRSKRKYPAVGCPRRF